MSTGVIKLPGDGVDHSVNSGFIGDTQLVKEKRRASKLLVNRFFLFSFFETSVLV